VYVRPSIPLEQARAIVSWNALSGQLYASSDWLPALPPERLDLLKRTLQPHGVTARPVDLLDTAVPKIWLVSDTRQTPRRDVVGLFNWSNAAADIGDTFERIGLPAGPDYLAFDFWANALLPVCKGRIERTVPATSCAVLAVRALADHPQLISTSRHVTQGIVDVVSESWDAGTGELSGVSRVVGGDPYELRLALNSTKGLWTAVSADGGALKLDGALARVMIESAQSADVKWAVKLKAP
jgi:hypothetical protein